MSSDFNFIAYNPAKIEEKLQILTSALEEGVISFGDLPTIDIIAIFTDNHDLYLANEASNDLSKLQKNYTHEEIKEGDFKLVEFFNVASVVEKGFLENSNVLHIDKIEQYLVTLKNKL